MEVRLDQTKRVSNVTILLMLFGLVSCYLNFSYYCTPNFQGISELDIKNTLWHLLVPSWFCYGFVWLQFQDMCSLKPVHSWDQLLLFLCSQKSRKVLLILCRSTHWRKSDSKFHRQNTLKYTSQYTERTIKSLSQSRHNKRTISNCDNSLWQWPVHSTNELRWWFYSRESKIVRYCWTAILTSLL